MAKRQKRQELMEVPFFHFDLDSWELVERNENIKFEDDDWFRSPIKAIRAARKLMDSRHRHSLKLLKELEDKTIEKYLDSNNRLMIPGMFR